MAGVTRRALYEYLYKMRDFASQSCVPCRGHEPPLSHDEIEERLNELPEWELVRIKDVPRLRRRFSFPDFAEALAFTAGVGSLAEEQDHHPRIVTQWGRVTVEWWTHKIHGLHDNDFVMAAKTDASYDK